ncbi:hypothetical protein HPULCUR_010638 [Helicostylum pulchrum]|uniref:Uncharacterized protein n=1 Tax=Helicostylum pulchrum TaxID=562976 RepID=A0ABP9YDT6_9FUNG
MVLGNNCNPELNPNVKLYLDGKFDDLAAQINTLGSRSEYLEDKLNGFKKELSDMFENQTQDILKLIKESHKEILETVESKLESPAKDTTKIQASTEIQPYTTETQPTTEIQPTTNIESSPTTNISPSRRRVRRRVRRIISFPSIGPAVINYLSESNEGWDLACQYTSPRNKKVTTAIIDYILKNPTEDILNHLEHSTLDDHQKLDIITNKIRNYFYNLRTKDK